MIELQNITKKYQMGRNSISVLNDINLTIKKGEMVSIMGKSGCGKSTLINIIGALTNMTSGRYFYNENEIIYKNRRKLAEFRFKEIGYIVQNFALINTKTAYENIEVPLYKQKSEEVHKIIKKYSDLLSISDKLDHYPYELSGGECQRVAIARALVKNPKMLLADEPTGSLDSHNEKIIINYLRSIADQGTTVIIVTHDSAVANVSDRIINMKDGKILI
ncbi:ABC transporter ATP-binding protein [Candidatus Gracilibacteria bacterium]|jgi:putative ABC transport system ATP-binding protein|nr:ABC transporter ATP-binding protein [Candidatus Gracilibacteria bacterium]